MEIRKWTLAALCAALIVVGATRAQAWLRSKVDPKTTSAGWVRIPTKGQTFTFGQQFEGNGGSILFLPTQ